MPKLDVIKEMPYMTLLKVHKLAPGEQLDVTSRTKLHSSHVPSLHILAYVEMVNWSTDT